MPFQIQSWSLSIILFRHIVNHCDLGPPPFLFFSLHPGVHCPMMRPNCGVNSALPDPIPSYICYGPLARDGAFKTHHEVQQDVQCFYIPAVLKDPQTWRSMMNTRRKELKKITSNLFFGALDIYPVHIWANDLICPAPGRLFRVMRPPKRGTKWQLIPSNGSRTEEGERMDTPDKVKFEHSKERHRERVTML